MRRQLPPTTLKHYVNRYRADKKMLENLPEHRELLEKRIERHKEDIINYVTSDWFQSVLKNVNL